LTEIYLCNACSCQEILRRNGRGQSIAPGEASWQLEPPLPRGCDASAGCVLGGRIYIAGAHGLAAYDPELRSWDASLPPPPSNSGGGPFFSSPAVASHADSVWIIGGSGGETGETACWSFTPAGGSGGEWRQGPPLPTSLAWGAAWSVEGLGLLAIGGARWSTDAQTYVFDDRTFVLA
jgi:hypothetical protein